MTDSGFPRRLRSRRVALAAAGTGAAVIAAAAILGPTDTIASFADNVWTGAGFSAGSFGIESSLTNDPESYENHSDSPLTLNFGAPISLAPGEVSYAGFYIRRTEDTSDYANVTVSGPTGEDESSGELWNDHLTFVAKAAPAVLTTTCNESIFTNENWIVLYSSGTLADPGRVDDATFTLGEPVLPELPPGEPYMVCFQFTLDADVVTEAPEANGESVHPVWTFTAESRQP